MSVFLRPNELHIKDPVTKEYSGMNAVIANDSIQEVFDELEEAVSDAETAMETKAAETIASIPDDYTELSNEVDELKADLNANSDYLLSKSVKHGFTFNANFFPGTLNGSTANPTTSSPWKRNATHSFVISGNTCVYFKKTNWRYMYYYFSGTNTFIKKIDVFYSGISYPMVEAKKYGIDNATCYKIQLVAWDEVNNQANVAALQLTNEEAENLGKEVYISYIIGINDNLSHFDKNDFMPSSGWYDRVWRYYNNIATLKTVIEVEQGDTLSIRGIIDNNIRTGFLIVNKTATLYNAGWMEGNGEYVIPKSGGILIQFGTADESAVDVSSFTGEITIKKTAHDYTTRPVFGLKLLGYRTSKLWNYKTAKMQGIAIYNGVLFQAIADSSSEHDRIKAYNLSDGTLLGDFTAETGHGNTINFGTHFYDDQDDYPLMYAGDVNNNGDNYISEIRIQKTDSVFSATTIKKYLIPSECGYYTQAAADDLTGIFVSSGYKENEYDIDSGTNRIIISVLDMVNAVYDSETGVYVPPVLKHFEIPFAPYTQDCKIFAGKFWLCYSKPTANNTTVNIIDFANGTLQSQMVNFITDIKNSELEGIDFVSDESGKYSAVLAVQGKAIYRVDFIE